MSENNNMQNEQQQEQQQQGAPSRTSKRGFASMDPAKQREIASKGGKAAHKLGVAHQWTADEARVAGRKGGEAVSRNKEHMAEIGRRGGEASHSSGRRSDSSESSSSSSENGSLREEE